MLRSFRAHVRPLHLCSGRDHHVRPSPLTSSGGPPGSWLTVNPTRAERAMPVTVAARRQESDFSPTLAAGNVDRSTHHSISAVDSRAGRCSLQLYRASLQPYVKTSRTRKHTGDESLWDESFPPNQATRRPIIFSRANKLSCGTIRTLPRLGSGRRSLTYVTVKAAELCLPGRAQSGTSTTTGHHTNVSCHGYSSEKNTPMKMR